MNDAVLQNQINRSDALERRALESTLESSRIRRGILRGDFPLSRDSLGRLLTVPFPLVLRPSVTTEPFETLFKRLPSTEMAEMSYEERRGEVASGGGG